MNKYLKDIFLHLDGIAMTPIYQLIYIIKNRLNSKDIPLIDLSEYGDYIHVLLSILEGQDLIKKNDENHKSIRFEWTENSNNILSKNNDFSSFKDYYISSINLIEGNNEHNLSTSFNRAYQDYLKYVNEYSDEKSLISKHLEGALIAPILIYYNYVKPQSNLINDLYDKKLNDILDFLNEIDIIKRNSLTEKGEYILSKSYAYGVTDSYMRTFIHLEDLCLNPQTKGCLSKDLKFKSINFLKNKENHVNRALNVWGSGKSHTTYFKYIDNYIIDIFNRPIDDQPIGIADMGCGDGSFLYHLNNLVKNNTLRGDHLNSHPLFLIGADYNQAALDETSKMFFNEDNKPMTVLADISKPAKYAKKIKNSYDLNISDFLNVRSFLDHNRTYKNTDSLGINFKNATTNSFVWKGQRISSNQIQENLVNHFMKWKKYVSKYGLLILELHSININKINHNIGKVPMTAYISTHGFSDQFMIEYEVYKECIEHAGLKIDKKYEKIFPNNDIKMISINLIS